MNDILKEVSMTSISGSSEIDIKQVDFDSRKVVQGSIFVAVKGTRSDGHTYIEKAIKSKQACKRSVFINDGDSDKRKKAVSYSLKKLVEANLLHTNGGTGSGTTYTVEM